MSQLKLVLEKNKEAVEIKSIKCRLEDGQLCFTVITGDASVFLNHKASRRIMIKAQWVREWVMKNVDPKYLPYFLKKKEEAHA